MLGFSPFKKHANKFNYIPRYYDPEKEGRGRTRVLKMVVAAVFVMLFIYLLYPKLAEFFLRAQQGKTPAGQTQVEQGTFDPYAPILVVPNDYEEE